ncbi:MAG: hypothetical protein DBX55_03705 [Verrucomicrobia bacterium]|nr:MAG: hypothetical protein DBX55_03705 [Verrucomicrobiota bacterium]
MLKSCGQICAGSLYSCAFCLWFFYAVWRSRSIVCACRGLCRGFFIGLVRLYLGLASAWKVTAAGQSTEYRATIFNFALRWEAGLFIEIKIQGDKEI